MEVWQENLESPCYVEIVSLGREHLIVTHGCTAHSSASTILEITVSIPYHQVSLGY